MSGREWKSGDVARFGSLRGLITSRGGRLQVTWEDGSANDLDTVALKPLVVIDPEDREQTSRLAAELQRRDVYHDNDATLAQVVSLALHALVAPPEPPEPCGLGALVEAKYRDSEGKGFGPCTWAKAGDGSWVCLTDGLSRTATAWPFLVDVRVLTEGVTA